MLRTLIYLTVVFLLVLSSVHAAEVPSNFKSLISQSDLIVEGEIIRQVTSSQKNISGRVGQADTSVIFGWGKNNVAALKINRIYKGRPPKSSIVTVYSQDDMARSHNKLFEGRRYLLFLKQHKFKYGFVPVNHSNAQWLIFDYNGQPKMKSWHQIPGYRTEDEYVDYTRFIVNLEQALSPVYLTQQN